MKVAVFGTKVSERFIPVLKEFFAFLTEHGVEVQLYEPFFEFLNQVLGVSVACSSFFRSHVDFDSENSYVFSIGGDGTFLQSVYHTRCYSTPIIGVNSGRLGFLADIAEGQIRTALENIFSGNYKVVKRSMLEVNIDGVTEMDFNYALNEMTVLKTDNSSMINVKAYIDGEFLNNYWADGLIVATPTGSTAYSLSVGGPILTPNSENFVITPLAPHNLTIRPIVVPDNSKITLLVEGRGSSFLASLDSRSVSVGFSTSISIQKAAQMLQTLELPGQQFFQTLRNKLMWGADLRN